MDNWFLMVLVLHLLMSVVGGALLYLTNELVLMEDIGG